MKRAGDRSRLCRFLFLLGLLVPGPALAQGEENLAPYKMLRSLQFVQDSVVHGDHSAGEMQRFMLETIDRRLRAADASVFDDPRNVDAALIYAMSGGNPATLEYLVARDIGGNFDTRVVDALRKYFGGQGRLIARTLSEMVPEYRDTRIGAYLALVSGNIAIASDARLALGFFDEARLGAPGTIVEEAALRRSLSVGVDTDMVEKSLALANRYVRRFLYSPYAGQFADLFVQLVVEHYGEVREDDMEATLALMDDARAREIYLRIARRATLEGKHELARSAAVRAEALAGAPDGREPLSSLYGNVANIPTADVGAAIEAISAIPDDELSGRDRALRDAARAVAEEILKAPAPASLTQGAAPTTEGSGRDAQSRPPAPEINDPGPAGPSGMQAAAEAVAGGDVEPAYRSFIDQGRSRLEAIDELLQQESGSR